MHLVLFPLCIQQFLIETVRLDQTEGKAPIGRRVNRLPVEKAWGITGSKCDTSAAIAPQAASVNRARSSAVHHKHEKDMPAQRHKELRPNVNHKVNLVRQKKAN
uniref:Putative secreted protein n=1 Tax=Amblyomma triste TaxID=251400 RepID=A0A023G1V7_AMBTT